MDKENNAIYKGIASIKYMNEIIANEMYELRDNKYNNFMELLIDLQEKTSLNSRQLNILIAIDFFEEFGKSQKLLDILNLFNNIMSKKLKSKKGEVSFNKSNPPYPKEIIEKYATDKSKEDRYKQYKVENVEDLCNELINNILDIEMSSIEKIRVNLEMMGECGYHFEDYANSICVVLDIDTKYKTKKAKLFNVASGRIAEVKIGEGDFSYSPFKSLDVVEIQTMIAKPKKVEVIKENGKKSWRNSPTEKEFYLTEYLVLNDEEIEELNKEEKEYRLSIKSI
jgi:hypothetical protein